MFSYLVELVLFNMMLTKIFIRILC